MRLKITLVAIVSALSGAVIATLGTYTFYTAFIDEMLSARYSTELAQDIVMYKSVQNDDHDKLSRLLRIRMVSDVVGLRAQCKKLSPRQKIRAEELFQKMNDLGIDASAVLGVTVPESATAECL